MARITAAQLRALRDRDRVEGIIDNLLQEATAAATTGATELPISPLHIFNKRINQPERDQAKAQLEALGFELEHRVINERVAFWVLKW